MMQNDLLERLGEVARSEEGAVLSDRRLERLLLNDLAPEELLQLEAEAKHSPDLALAVELFRPQPIPKTLPNEPVNEPTKALAPERPKPPASTRRAFAFGSRASLWAHGAGTAVLSGALAFAALRTPAVPIMVAELSLQQRGDDLDAYAIALNEGAKLRLVIAPAPPTKLDGSVDVRAFLFQEGEGRAWPVPFTQSGSGTITLEGDVDVLFSGLSAGAWDMVFAVGRASDVPHDLAALKALEAEHPNGNDDVRLVRKQIVLKNASGIALGKAAELRAEARYAEAREIILPLLEAPSLVVRARATGMLARIDAAVSSTEAEHTSAIKRYRDAIALDREANLVREEHMDTYALSYVLAVSGRFEAARGALATLPKPSSAFPEEAAHTPYYRGVVSKEAGDLGAALSFFETAASEARRLDEKALELDATTMEITVLISIGRTREAAEKMPTLEAALAAEKVACRRAGLLDNIGYFWMTLRPDAAQTTQRTLEDAVSAYRDTCAKSRPLANALTSLAAAQLVVGSPNDARRAIASARRAIKDGGPILEAAWETIDGQALFALGRYEEAASAFASLSRRGAEQERPDAKWTAAIGMARVLDAQGHFKEAGRAYADASALVAYRAITVPLGEGRGVFSSKLAEANELEVDFLLRRGSPDAAATAARRARARSAALMRWNESIEALDDAGRRRWSQAVMDYRSARRDMDEAGSDREAIAFRLRAARDEALSIVGASSLDGFGEGPLEAPKADEVFLVYHPIPGGWAGFAVAPGGARTARLGAIDPSAPPAALAPMLFEPFAAELETAKQVRVMAYGALGARDFHAFPWQGGPLIETKSVSYGLDIGRPSIGHPHNESTPVSAVIVGDPSEDLASAGPEAEYVASTLAKQGMTTRLFLRSEATVDAVREALEAEGTRLFHYAGHATFTGTDGWQSKLSLASGKSLGLGDLLRLSHVPETIVLSGCDTGKTGEALDLGLAQAFLLAGASEVIATTRPVRDDLARTVIESLYGSKNGPGTGRDVAWALQEASRKVIAKHGGADWASFRVIVP